MMSLVCRHGSFISGRCWVLLVVLLAQLAGCGSPSAQPPRQESESKRGGVVRVALWQEPALLNPLLGTQVVTEAVGRTMLEGLLRAQPDGQRSPALAAEVPSFENGGISPDGLTITWRLKPGVLWADGKPFSSKDVLFTYNVVMNPGNPIINLIGYPDIESVTT